MRKNLNISFFLITYPVTLLISLTLNLLILFHRLESRYMGLGLILISVCSTAYILRLTMKTHFFKLPMPKEEANLFAVQTPFLVKLVSTIAVLALIFWAVTLFLISLHS